MTAILSEDRKYRYLLTRYLGGFGAGRCCFVMLNPSTADETRDDPTIKRCIGYATTFDCDRLEVVNLFAYRATDPSMLYPIARDTAVGPRNDDYIVQACKTADIVVCGWGNHGELHGRGNEVLRLIRGTGAKPQALKINGSTKQPGHPLYLKADAALLEIA